MPYNLRRNANGRRESSSNDNETAPASIKTPKSVNLNIFTSMEAELDLEQRVAAVVDMMMAQTRNARQSAQTFESPRRSRRASRGVSNAQQGGDHATTQHEDPQLKTLLDQVRDHYHQRDSFLQKEIMKLTLLHAINMENLFTAEAVRPINGQWEVGSDYAETEVNTEVDGGYTSGITSVTVIHTQNCKVN